MITKFRERYFYHIADPKTLSPTILQQNKMDKQTALPPEI